MARFLLTVWPFDNHINPNIALAQTLRERGHDVAFYTGGEAEVLVVGQGYRCFAFQKVDFSLVLRAKSSITSQRSLDWRTAALWRDFTLGTVPAQVQDLKAIFQTWRPDVIVCDVAMWGPILISHETERVPVAVYSHTAYCILHGRNGPVPGIALPPPRTPAAKLVSRAVWTLTSFAASRVRRRASEIRRAYGLSSLSTGPSEFAGTMPLYLVPSTPELDYQRNDLPRSVHYVGSCLWDEPATQPVPDWVRERSADRALILVVEGTSDPILLQVAAQGLADVGDAVVLVAGKGHDLQQLRLGRTAANVRVEPWVPLKTVLPSASVVVCNGNSETVLAALSQGLPMVIVPSMLDQPEMSWRVSESGAGVRLARRQCTPLRLRESVKLVKNDARFRINAAKLGSNLSQRGGVRRAAELLEDLVTS